VPILAIPKFQNCPLKGKTIKNRRKSSKMNTKNNHNIYIYILTLDIIIEY